MNGGSSFDPQECQFLDTENVVTEKERRAPFTEKVFKELGEEETEKRAILTKLPNQFSLGTSKQLKVRISCHGRFKCSIVKDYPVLIH